MANWSASCGFDISGVSRHLKQRVYLWRNIDRFHRLAWFRAHALDGNLPCRDFHVTLGHDAFVPDRARVLADDPQMDLEVVAESQGTVKLERGFDPRPSDMRAIGDAQPGLAPHRMFGFLHVTEEPAEMDD